MERNPFENPNESSLFAKPLASLTRLCCRNPISVLVLGILMAILSVYLAVEHLGFKMSRLDLINPNSGFNRLWLDYIDEFGDNDEVIVVAEGRSNVEIIPVLNQLSERIARHPDLFQGVLHGVDLSTIRLKGLHYVPMRELEIINRFALDSAMIADGHWDRLGVDAMLDSITMRLQTSEDPETLIRTVRELDSFSLSLSGALGSIPSFGSPWPSMQGPQAAVPDVVAACSQNDTSYFLFPTKTGVMGFVLLKLANVDKTQLAQGTASIEKLRSIVGEVRESHPSVRIGLTGMPIIENDEMRLSSDSMTEATILAFIGVAAIFMAGFGGLRHPLFAMIGLLIAFAWTMGYITLSVGHLNILSISFGAMLIGLGTDFSVHYVARYLELRREGYSSEKALCRTAYVVGPGILTGAFTTSAAFYMASFTEFTGVAELGIISGGGVMFCAIATFVLVPAMIQLSDGNRINQPLPAPLDIRGSLKPALKFPVTTLVAFMILATFLMVGVPKVWYDHNLLNLQPEGLESVELEHRLLDMDVEQGGKNVWFALSIADTKEELLARKELFAEKYPELTVEEIVSWLPGADEQKVPLIRSLAEALENLPERPPEIAVLGAENVGGAIARLQQFLMDPRNPLRQLSRQLASYTASHQDDKSDRFAEIQSTAASLEESVPKILRRLGEARESIRRMSQSEYRNRMAQYQSAVAGDLLTRLRVLRSMAIPEPPTVDDLPEPLVERFVGKRGKHLMRIYTTANIWNMDEMQKFVEAVRDIDPKATGSPLQTYESSLQMQQGFLTAAIYAFGAIFILLLIDFRSLKDAFVSLIPMIAGFSLMFGVLGWLDIPLNPANMIVLPLILGIGIDDGVHMVHDYRARRGRYRLSASTATSVLITSLTTIVGFGSMMIATHRGLQSLGRVLVIGVFCCMFTSLVVLPNLLSIWSRDEEEEPETVPQRKETAPGVQYVAEEAPSALIYEEYVHEQEMICEPTESEMKQKRLTRRSAS